MKLNLLILFLASQAMSQEITRLDASTPSAVQIQIIRSAAPATVTAKASIYVLGKNGYQLAVQGTNGFTCAIDRERPDTMEPECYDAEGGKSTFKVREFVEKQRAAGMPEEKIEQLVAAGYKSARFKPPSKPGIVYMLSDSNYVFDPSRGQIIHFPGHLMFYAPYATEGNIGSGVGAPYIVHSGQPDALLIVVPAK